MVLFMVFNCVWEQVKTLKKMKGMAMNYNKLWKLLIDRNLMKKDLIQMAGITTNAMAKICKALDCKIEDIVEVEKTIDSP